MTGNKSARVFCYSLATPALTLCSPNWTILEQIY